MPGKSTSDSVSTCGENIFRWIGSGDIPCYTHTVSLTDGLYSKLGSTHGHHAVLC